MCIECKLHLIKEMSMKRAGPMLAWTEERRPVYFTLGFEEQSHGHMTLTWSHDSLSHNTQHGISQMLI